MGQNAAINLASFPDRRRRSIRKRCAESIRHDPAPALDPVVSCFHSVYRLRADIARFPDHFSLSDEQELAVADALEELRYIEELLGGANLIPKMPGR